MQNRVEGQVSSRSGRFGIVPATQVAVLLAALVGGLLFFADDWRGLLFIGTFFPISIAGVVARAGLPPYRSRLPHRSQIVLAVALVAGSIPAVFLGEQFHLSVLWVCVIPTLLPDAVPEPLLEKLRNTAHAERTTTGADGDGHEH